MKELLLYMMLTTSAASCAKPNHNENLTLPAAVQKDVPYGTHPKQKLDIYLPAGRNSRHTKLMILIHGGGWSGGDKVDFNAHIMSLQKTLTDYAFATINYRLMSFTENKFPTQENDVQAAVQFLLNNKEHYQITDRVVLLGASAGAHLALLQAYKHSEMTRPEAVVSFFGPTDLIDMFNNPGLADVPYLLKIATGADPLQKAGAYKDSSPINYVTAQSSPTLLLHGGRDNLVPYRQSVLLKEKLETLNVPQQLVYYPNEAHGWIGNNMADSYSKIVAFLKKHVP